MGKQRKAREWWVAIDKFNHAWASHLMKCHLKEDSCFHAAAICGIRLKTIKVREVLPKRKSK